MALPHRSDVGTSARRPLLPGDGLLRSRDHVRPEVTLDGDDIAGLGVAIGARVGAKAGPSEVLVSQTVRDLVAGSGLVFEDAGEHELKGVPDRWHLYRVVD
jgi:class 3 adenylate cyclase